MRRKRDRLHQKVYYYGDPPGNSDGDILLKTRIVVTLQDLVVVGERALSSGQKEVMSHR